MQLSAMILFRLCHATTVHSLILQFHSVSFFTELEALKNDVLTYGKIRASYAEVGQAGTYYPSYYRTPVYGGGFSSGTLYNILSDQSAHISHTTRFMIRI